MHNEPLPKFWISPSQILAALYSLHSPIPLAAGWGPGCQGTSQIKTLSIGICNRAAYHFTLLSFPPTVNTFLCNCGYQHTVAVRTHMMSLGEHLVTTMLGGGLVTIQHGISMKDNFTAYTEQ